MQHLPPARPGLPRHSHEPKLPLFLGCLVRQRGKLHPRSWCLLVRGSSACIWGGGGGAGVGTACRAHPLTGGCSTCSPDTPCPQPHPLPSAAESSPSGGLPLSGGRSGSRPLGVDGGDGELDEPSGGSEAAGRPSPAAHPSPGGQLTLLTLHELHDDVDGLLLGADADETHDVGVAVLLQDPGGGGAGLLRLPPWPGRGSYTFTSSAPGAQGA